MQHERNRGQLHHNAMRGQGLDPEPPDKDRGGRKQSHFEEGRKSNRHAQSHELAHNLKIRAPHAHKELIFGKNFRRNDRQEAHAKDANDRRGDRRPLHPHRGDRAQAKDKHHIKYSVEHHAHERQDQNFAHALSGRQIAAQHVENQHDTHRGARDAQILLRSGRNFGVLAQNQKDLLGKEHHRVNRNAVQHDEPIAHPCDAPHRLHIVLCRRDQGRDGKGEPCPKNQKGKLKPRG